MQPERRLTYSPAAKTFHWLTLGLLTIQYAIGWLMPDVHRGPPVMWTELHMSFGFLILFTIILRFGWRGAVGIPQWEPGMPAWQGVAAHGLHLGLYALIVFFVFTGWAFVSYQGWPISFFWLFPMPALWPKGDATARIFAHLHGTMVWILLGAVVIHVLAALYHHFVMKDRTLIRMLPRVASLRERCRDQLRARRRCGSRRPATDVGFDPVRGLRYLGIAGDLVGQDGLNFIPEPALRLLAAQTGPDARPI